LYPNARVIQVDTEPSGLRNNLRVADLHLKADAKSATEALTHRLRKVSSRKTGYRSSERARKVANEVFDERVFPVSPGTLDPRAALLELDKVIPKDWEIVVGAGHFFNFVLTHLRGRPAERWHVVTEFGAIGAGLPAAIGCAVARNHGKVLMLEGDGSIMMHIQELETIKRHNVRLLMCVLNDGGYGAEAHKFRAKHMDFGEAMHGRGNLPGVAQAFGLKASKVTSLEAFRSLFEQYKADGVATLWDVHISENIPSQQYRRIHFGED
jgi:thiamine pyrophosphate-dependent acetolactate synthase large subunit-like protein